MTIQNRDQHIEDLLQWVADGKAMRHFCKEPGRPAARTVYDWLDEDEEFSARFARAREQGADAIALEALDIIDEKPEYASSGDGSERIDSGYVAWQRARVDTRLKLLARWFPQKYGDKVDLSGNLSGVLSWRDTLDA